MADGFVELQRYALCVMQGLIGVVSNNFRFVSVNRQGQGIVVRVVLATHCSEDLEEIEDFNTELEAVLAGAADIEVEVTVSKQPIMLEPPSESTIVVFKRRE